MKNLKLLLAVGLILLMSSCRTSRPQITFFDLSSIYQHLKKDTVYVHDTAYIAQKLGEHNITPTWLDMNNGLRFSQRKLVDTNTVYLTLPYWRDESKYGFDASGAVDTTVTWKDFIRGIENDFSDRKRSFEKRIDSIMVADLDEAIPMGTKHFDNIVPIWKLDSNKLSIDTAIHINSKAYNQNAFGYNAITQSTQGQAAPAIGYTYIYGDLTDTSCNSIIIGKPSDVRIIQGEYEIYPNNVPCRRTHLDRIYAGEDYKEFYKTNPDSRVAKKVKKKSVRKKKRQGQFAIGIN